MKRLAVALALVAQSVAAQTPEQRAVDYLAQETPRWFRENSCFSCHNNGDAARALYVASQRGYKVPKEALAGTTEWLLKPLDWDNHPDHQAQRRRRAPMRAPTAGSVTWQKQEARHAAFFAQHELGHEGGPALYKMQNPGVINNKAAFNQSALDLENKVKQARDPFAPVRRVH
jgi:hypothetical protein